MWSMAVGQTVDCIGPFVEKRCLPPIPTMQFSADLPPLLSRAVGTSLLYQVAGHVSSMAPNFIPSVKSSLHTRVWILSLIWEDECPLVSSSTCRP